MKNRRGSLLWSGVYGDAILQYKVGDVVKPNIVTDHYFTGIVRDVDTKTNKITVAWGGGPVSQHDVDEIMPGPADVNYGTSTTKTASRRMNAADAAELIEAASVVAMNPPMDQFCGKPATHGLDKPVGGGFAVMNDLAYKLHDEANQFADVNPRLATSGNEPPAQRTVEEEFAKKSPVSRMAMSGDIVNKIMQYEDGEMDQEEIVDFFQELIDTGTIHSLQGNYGRMAQHLIQQGLCHPKGRAASSHTATGEMGMHDIQPGGEHYEWAQQIEKAAKEVQKLTERGGYRVSFLGMKPFDVYQGPYAIMTEGKLWSSDDEGQFYFEFRLHDGISGTPKDIASEILSRKGITASADQFAGLKSRRAMYWCAPDRTFRLTQQEQQNGAASCPKCKSEMQVEPFTRSDKLMICPECRFKVPTSKAVTTVEVKVPAGVEVDVTTQDENGEETSGEMIMATRRGHLTASGQKYKGYTIEKSGDNFYVKDPSGHRAFGETPATVEAAKKWIDMELASGKTGSDCRRGRLAAVDMDALKDLPRMTLSQIASLIYQDWKNVNFAARPYLEAMSSLQNVSDMYMQESGTSIVAYWLSNASSYKGEVAKAIKKELQRRIR